MTDEKEAEEYARYFDFFSRNLEIDAPHPDIKASNLMESWNDTELLQHLHQLEAKAYKLEQNAALEVSNTKTKAKIAKPAGHFWVAVLGFVYSRQTFERVYEPHIQDMRYEQLEALAANQQLRARWVVWRGNLVVVQMIGLHMPLSFVNYILRLWPLIRG